MDDVKNVECKVGQLSNSVKSGKKLKEIQRFGGKKKEKENWENFGRMDQKVLFDEVGDLYLNNSSFRLCEGARIKVGM